CEVARHRVAGLRGRSHSPGSGGGSRRSPRRDPRLRVRSPAARSRFQQALRNGRRHSVGSRRAQEVSLEFASFPGRPCHQPRLLGALGTVVSLIVHLSGVLGSSRSPWRSLGGGLIARGHVCKAGIFMKFRLLVAGWFAVVSVVLVSGQSAKSQETAAPVTPPAAAAS